MPVRSGGVYAVISELSDSKEIPVGKSRSYYLSKGYYTYVGSALNGLEKRLERHLSNRKNMHWHIDYLLESAAVRGMIFATTPENMGCSVADSLSKELPSIPGFGCSDCRCDSHLFFSPDKRILIDKVMYGFTENNLIVQNRDIKV